MEIDKKILEAGLTKEMLLYFHSRTNNKEYKIKKALLSTWQLDGPLKITILLDNENNSIREYTIDVAKIRQKRLNILLK